MRKICDLNNSGTSADFRCKKSRNHGDCGGSVKVFYLPLNSVNFCFDRMTRNQVVLTGSWVRIPPAPPRRSKLCIACSDFFTKIRARSRRCSSFPRKAGGFAGTPNISCVSLAAYIFAKAAGALIPLRLLFRKKSRSARLFGCKRPHDGSLSLPTFCELRGFNSHLRKAEKIFSMCLSHAAAC